MKSKKKLLFNAVLLLSVAIGFCGCGSTSGGVTDPLSSASTGSSQSGDSAAEEYPALTYTAENDPHVKETGGSLYYVGDDGENVKGRYAFYDNDAYYFTQKDATGVKFDIVQVTEHIIGIVAPGGCYFIIEGDEKALVIDTGFGYGNTRELVEMILGSTPYEVALTHTDPDHVGGVFDFTNTNVYTTAVDAADAQNSWGQERRAEDVVYDTSRFAIEDLSEEDDAFEFSIFKNGQIFSLGNYDVEVIYAPGHTAGSVFFLLKGDKILLSGDNGCPTVMLSASHSTTVETFHDSLAEINKRNGEWNKLLTNHIGASLSSKKVLDNLITLSEKILTDYPSNSAESEAVFSETYKNTQIKFDTSKVHD